MSEKATYFELATPETEIETWCVKLGSSPEINYDQITGEEDFSEFDATERYFVSWKPGQRWHAPKVCIIKEFQRTRWGHADCLGPHIVGPFFSKSAVKLMRPYLENDGHVLPLDVVNCADELYIWLVPWVANSIDFHRSEKYAGERTVKNAVLNYEKVEGLTAFRGHYHGMHNPNIQGEVFVNDAFRQEWIKHGLTGIEFKPVLRKKGAMTEDRT